MRDLEKLDELCHGQILDGQSRVDKQAAKAVCFAKAGKSSLFAFTAGYRFAAASEKMMDRKIDGLNRRNFKPASGREGSGGLGHR
jgi:hypothetical protein